MNMGDMSVKWALAAVAVVGIASTGVAAGAQDPLAAESAPSVKARELLEDCDAHRFETIVAALVDGQFKRSRVKLCGVKGQTDAQWIESLRDSAAKLTVNTGIAPAMRSEMVKAINTEIASLEKGGGLTRVGKESFDLKPRPAPKATPDVKAGYTSLPPLPPPVVVKTETGPYVPPPPINRPDLRFQCFSTANGAGEGPCVEFDRFTVVIVQAREPVAPGALLRFIRNGEEKGEVAIASLKKGQRQRISLPSEVCKGVVGGELKIETLATPQGGKAPPRVADEQGPFELRCT